MCGTYSCADDDRDCDATSAGNVTSTKPTTSDRKARTAQHRSRSVARVGQRFSLWRVLPFRGALRRVHRQAIRGRAQQELQHNGASVQAARREERVKLEAIAGLMGGSLSLKTNHQCRV